MNTDIKNNFDWNCKHTWKQSAINKSTRRYIYKLFPYGYGQQACKIAGMRQPKKLWLDM